MFRNAHCSLQSQCSVWTERADYPDTGLKAWLIESWQIWHREAGLSQGEILNYCSSLLKGA